jgi:hypothetical protein
MSWHHWPKIIARRQTNLLFDGDRLGALEALDREKVITAVAHILMQAAGLRVEEVDDDEL